MADLSQVIKLTSSQYATLAQGGTVGSYTGLQSTNVYLVEDPNEYLPTSGGEITGCLAIEQGYLYIQGDSFSTYTGDDWDTIFYPDRLETAYYIGGSEFHGVLQFPYISSSTQTFATQEWVSSNYQPSGNYAPSNHASTATTYGSATSTLYGHVKLSSGNLSNVTYADGLAAAASHNHDGRYYSTAAEVSSALGLGTAAFSAATSFLGSQATAVSATNAASLGGSAPSWYASSAHSHNLSIVASTGTAAITLAYGSSYTLTAGGKDLVFKMPAADNTNYYHTPANYTSTNALLLGTGTGVSNMYISYATSSTYGVVKDEYTKTVYIGTSSYATSTGSVTLPAYPANAASVGAAPASHSHGNILSDGTITATAVTAATGFIVYDSNNKIQRATTSNASTILGLGTAASYASTAFLSSGTTIPNPANYYWANVKVSANSATNTAPTFATVSFTSAYLMSGATSKAAIQYNSTTGCMEIIC